MNPCGPGRGCCCGVVMRAAPKPAPDAPVPAGPPVPTIMGIIGLLDMLEMPDIWSMGPPDGVIMRFPEEVEICGGAPVAPGGGPINGGLGLGKGTPKAGRLSVWVNLS